LSTVSALESTSSQKYALSGILPIFDAGTFFMFLKALQIDSFTLFFIKGKNEYSNDQKLPGIFYLKIIKFK
jgi:hypothetical protein